MAGSADNICVGLTSFSINDTDVGYTKGGVTIRVPRELMEHMADQVVGVVKVTKTNEQMFVKTTFSEATLANLAIAWDHASFPTNYIGNSTSVAQSYDVDVVGVGPSGTTRTFALPTCVSMNEGALGMGRELDGSVEVEFQVLKDSSGRFGTVVDA